MKIDCDFCGVSILRTKSTAFVRGAKRNFCSIKCVGLFRTTQVGVNASAYKHGGKGTRLYRIWKNMKTRCSNPKSQAWKYYGGRGINMCDSWMSNFSKFKQWAMTNGYADNLQIDRRNNDGDYEPSNCRWLTHAQNMTNSRNFKRTNSVIRKIVELRSESVPFSKISILVGVSKSTVQRAIYQDRKKIWEINQRKVKN